MKEKKSNKQVEFLNKFFEDNGISRADISAKTLMSPSTVSNVMNGRCAISKAFAFKLNDAFGISVNYLLYGMGEPLSNEATDGELYKVVVSGKFCTSIRVRATDKDTANELAKARVINGEYQEDALKVDPLSLSIVE